PVSAAWSGMAQVPMLVSLAFTLSLWTFITMFAHPFVYPWAAEGYRPNAALFGPVSGKGLAIIAFPQQAGGGSGLVPHTVVLTGLVLLVVRRWGRGLLAGGMTVVFALNAAALSVLNDHYQGILVAGLAGLSADLLRAVLKPSTGRPRAF